MNVILIGGTATGKSLVGASFARLIGFGYLDTDREIEKKMGKKVSQIFLDKGEDAFRQMERDVINFISTVRSHVIVVGAGAVEDELNFAALKKLGVLVWITSPYEEIARRLLKNPKELATRPLLAEVLKIEDISQRFTALKLKLEELAVRREERYREAPYSIVTGYSTPDAGARQLKIILFKNKILDSV